MERESDKEEIKNLISSGVKVETNLKPIQARQDLMEKAQADMSDHFKDMVEEVKELKSQLQKPSTNSQEPQPALYSSVLSGQHGSAPFTKNTG